MEDPEKYVIRKKFNEVTNAGLGVAKNGKLRFPYTFKMRKAGTDEHNNYGQPRPKVGDYCCNALPSGLLTAGTVGRIIAEDPNEKTHDGSYTVELLDGSTTTAWRYGTGHLTEEQVKEVVDYYKKENRTERIKANWAPK
jgi:hypothetical protein